MQGNASISNIAWPIEEDARALTLVADLGFAGVELAPRKVFGPLDEVSTQAVRRYREDLAARGLSVSALQAILFGVEDAHLFRDERSRSSLRSHLIRVAEVAGELGARACVFGSPALRDPGDLSPERALDSAVEFFAALAPRFATAGTQLAFEANPPLYGCRFVTRTREALELVRRVDTEGFALQIDTGTLLANGEEMSEVEEALPYAAHFHISEAGLVPPGSASADHVPIARAAAKGAYSGWYSIEMKEGSDWRQAIASVLPVLRTYPARLTATPADLLKT